VDPLVEIRFRFCILSPGGRKSFGGIAQLVERLVRNEKVRGSNPLTSKAKGVEVKSTCRADYGCTSGSVILLPPVFARVLEASEDCRAVALVEVGHSPRMSR
jgi:hypothetical protein